MKYYVIKELFALQTVFLLKNPLIPGLGRSPGEGNGNPLQYSCLENPMDGGAWWATVHWVAKSWTWLSNFTSLHFTYLSKVFTKKSY